MKKVKHEFKSNFEQVKQNEKIKIYDDIEDLFNDGILSPTDCLVIWGKRRRGKSSLAGKLMSEFLKPRQARKDVAVATSICDKLNLAGFNIKPPTDHTVFCDTFFEIPGNRLHPAITTYRFNALEFGLPNSTHKTALLCPCGRYFFDETQALFDSHQGALPPFVSQAIELAGQYKLFLCFIVQRPMRLPKDVRDLSVFFEVISIENEFNSFGSLISSTWNVNVIYDNSVLEQYLTSKDPTLIDAKIKIRFSKPTYNIFDCYDTNYFLPMFVRGFENEALTLEKTQRITFNPGVFQDYYKNRIIDVPDSYRGKKPKEKGEKNAN